MNAKHQSIISHTIAFVLDSINAGVNGRLKRLARDERGEGVISASIAILIMAFLGAAMWVGFQTMWKNTEATTNTKIEQIGSE